jgi:hypothetical protein
MESNIRNIRITVSKSYNKKKKPNYIAIVGIEKSLINKHYDFLKCEQNGSILYCYGQFKPTQYSKTYKYRIKYAPPSRPVVTVIEPKIEYNDDIHVFPKDKSLCLYHKTDLVWDIGHHIFDTIVPWTHEWFVFYELYLITGKWEHPFVPHTIKKDE